MFVSLLRLYKFLHVLSIVFWPSSLFFITLLKIQLFNIGATNKNGSYFPQTNKAIKRILLFISTPTMIMSLLTGTIISYISGSFLQPWLHIKLIGVFLLIIVHIKLLSYINNTNQNKKIFLVYHIIISLSLILIIFMAKFKPFK